MVVLSEYHPKGALQHTCRILMPQAPLNNGGLGATIRHLKYEILAAFPKTRLRIERHNIQLGDLRAFSDLCEAV